MTCCCWMYHDLAVHSVRFSCPRVFIVGHVDADEMESLMESIVSRTVTSVGFSDNS